MRTGAADQPLGTPLLPTFSFGLGPLSSELSRLAMEVSFHPLSATSNAHPLLSIPALTIRAFLTRRKEFKELIAANVNLTYSNYWRLIALASLDFCFTIPLAIWTIVDNTYWSEVSPWVSWDNTHWGYSRVFQLPRVVIDLNPIIACSLETTRWAAVLCAFVFFAFFGFAGEARKNYRLVASAVAKRFGSTIFTETAKTSESQMRSSLHFASVHLPQESTVQSSVATTSPSMISVEKEPEDLEAALEPFSAKRPSVADDPEAAHPDCALGQV